MNFDKTLAKKLNSTFTFRLWMLRHLPMGWLSGMVIEKLDDQGCTVMLKDRWWIRNPFGSVFWAVMGMAAEMSTGAWIFASVSQSKTRFILVGLDARFYRKAKGKSYYICLPGMDVPDIFERILNMDDPLVVTLPVIAIDPQGEKLADFSFHWQLRKPTKLY